MLARMIPFLGIESLKNTFIAHILEYPFGISTNIICPGGTPI